MKLNIIKNIIIIFQFFLILILVMFSLTFFVKDSVSEQFYTNTIYIFLEKLVDYNLDTLEQGADGDLEIAYKLIKKDIDNIYPKYEKASYSDVLDCFYKYMTFPSPPREQNSPLSGEENRSQEESRLAKPGGRSTDLSRR